MRSVSLRTSRFGMAYTLGCYTGTSQSESDFVRYIHIVGLKFAVTNTGHRSAANKMQLQIEPSLCPGQLKLLDVVAGEIRVRTFHDFTLNQSTLTRTGHSLCFDITTQK